MNADSINVLSVFCCRFPDTVIDVVDLQIFPAEVRRISVDKTIIHAWNSVAFYAIALGQRLLHSVVGHKIMISPAHDLMGRIIEQVFHVEF